MDGGGVLDQPGLDLGPARPDRGRPVDEARRRVGAFREMVRSRGASEPDEELLGDGVAFAGVGRHANRVKCAMLGWTAFEDALARACTAAGGADQEGS